MLINDMIIKNACKAIDEGKESFGMGESMIFYVAEKENYVHEIGSMPSYFDYNGKRYVVYKKPTKKWNHLTAICLSKT